jgi:hypothetical protein
LTRQPPDWYTVGRQNTAWKTFGYIPTDWVDPSGATGLPTREASRAWEVRFCNYPPCPFTGRPRAVRPGRLCGPAGGRRAGQGRGGRREVRGPRDELCEHVGCERDERRVRGLCAAAVSRASPPPSSSFVRKYSLARAPAQNGTFAFSPPNACSPVDPVGHSCARGTDNNVGFYECALSFFCLAMRRSVLIHSVRAAASSWEYSFFAPHSMATLVALMGGPAAFISRVCVAARPCCSGVR